MSMDDASKPIGPGSATAPGPAPNVDAGSRPVASYSPKDQRRLMSMKACVAYCGMSVKQFNVMIRPRLIPIQNPITTKSSRKLWFDRHAVDREIDRLSGIRPHADEPPTSDDREYIQQQMEKRLLGRSSQTHRLRRRPNGRS